MKNKAFTLIELLVVVLIIGILAAIAVPQYQVAVGKSKFSTIKNMAKSIAEAEEVYYLANGQYTSKIADLDIIKPDNIECNIWAGNTMQKAVACSIYINEIKMRYYQFFLHDQPTGYQAGMRTCLAHSLDVNDIPNKICQQETGKKGQRHTIDGGYYDYTY